LKNLISYSNYVLEHSHNSELNELITTLSDFCFSSINEASDTNGEYVILQELEVSEPGIDVDIRFLLRKEQDISLKNDSHFSKMNWQSVKLDNNGYVVSGNTFMTDGNIPEIEIIIALDSNKVNSETNKKLYLNLNNTISHELNHLKQTGWNMDFQNIEPSSMEHRKKNNKKHSYFILPEEIESMVYGMNKQAEKQGVPIDTLFDSYLKPFVESEFMTYSEMMEIIRKWISHTLKMYPNASMSNKYDNIIDNI
jgi:hypothetical protein